MRLPNLTVLPTLLYGYGARKFPFPLFVVECDLRVCSKLLVLAVTDDHPDPLWPVAEVQRIIAVSGHRKPEITVHFFAQGRKMGKQIFAGRGPDLWNGLAFAADD